MQIQTVGLWEPPPNWVNHNLSKQQTFRDATTGFPAKLRLRNEHRNSILMTPHYLDISSAFDWLKQISHAARPIRNTTQIWVVTRHQHGISAFISRTSFRGETSGGIAKCRLFSPATWNNKITAQNILRRYKQRSQYKRKHGWPKLKKTKTDAIVVFENVFA